MAQLIAEEAGVADALSPLLTLDPATAEKTLPVQSTAAPLPEDSQGGSARPPLRRRTSTALSSRSSQPKGFPGAQSTYTPTPNAPFLPHASSPLPSHFTPHGGPYVGPHLGPHPSASGGAPSGMPGGYLGGPLGSISSTPPTGYPMGHLSIPGMRFPPVSPPNMSPAPSFPNTLLGSYGSQHAPSQGAPPHLTDPHYGVQPPSTAVPPAPPITDYPTYPIPLSGNVQLATKNDKEVLLEALIHAGESRSEETGTLAPLPLSRVGDVNAPLDESGNTALHWAAAYGLTDMVKDLISYGAKTNKRNKQGQTPIMMACRTNHARERNAFPLLFLHLAKWPSKHARFALAWANDKEGNTLFHHIALLASRHPDAAANYLRPLIAAIKQDALSTPWNQDKVQVVNQLINHQNAKDQTALLILALSRRWDLVDALVEAGGDPSLPDIRGLTPSSLIRKANRVVPPVQTLIPSQPQEVHPTN